MSLEDVRCFLQERSDEPTLYSVWHVSQTVVQTLRDVNVDTSHLGDLQKKRGSGSFAALREG